MLRVGFLGPGPGPLSRRRSRKPTPRAARTDDERLRRVRPVAVLHAPHDHDVAGCDVAGRRGIGLRELRARGRRDLHDVAAGIGHVDVLPVDELDGPGHGAAAEPSEAAEPAPRGPRAARAPRDSAARRRAGRARGEGAGAGRRVARARARAVAVLVLLHQHAPVEAGRDEQCAREHERRACARDDGAGAGTRARRRRRRRRAERERRSSSGFRSSRSLLGHGFRQHDGVRHS